MSFPLIYSISLLPLSPMLTKSLFSRSVLNVAVEFPFISYISSGSCADLYLGSMTS